MNRINKILGQPAIIIFLFLLIVHCTPGSFVEPVQAARALAEEQYFDELNPEELQGGRYFYMIDQKGRTILVTGRRLRVKDRFLNAKNELYEVESVEGYLARARFVEKIELKTFFDIFARPDRALPVQKEVKPAYKIALYHSHNAESYVPSDGTDSIYGIGGIHDVGFAFKDALERKGVNVLYSEQLHLPHDRGAYRRSRVTALRLIRERPDAIFDLHRDAAPWEKYALELNGEDLTQIQIVVGQSNPGSLTNEQFAFDLKGYADRLYPGLIHGVLLIWGSYNQDISPLSLLLEVGAHTNTKEAAQRGIARFAGVVSYYFYGPAYLKDKKIAPRPHISETAPANHPRYGIMRAFSGTILSLLLISMGAAFGFYFLNNPDALVDIYLWWRKFPEKAMALRRQSRIYWKNLPSFLKAVRRAAPVNLRKAWRKLCVEGPAVPRLLRKIGASALLLGRRGLDEIALIRQKAPQNLQRAWQLLNQESRDLPLLLHKRFPLLKKAAGDFIGRLTMNMTQYRKRVNLAWDEAKTEAAVIAGQLYKYILRLRNRLRT